MTVPSRSCSISLLPTAGMPPRTEARQPISWPGASATSMSCSPARNWRFQPLARPSRCFRKNSFPIRHALHDSGVVLGFSELALDEQAHAGQGHEPVVPGRCDGVLAGGITHRFGICLAELEYQPQGGFQLGVQRAAGHDVGDRQTVELAEEKHAARLGRSDQPLFAGHLVDVGEQAGSAVVGRPADNRQDGLAEGARRDQFDAVEGQDPRRGQRRCRGLELGSHSATSSRTGQRLGSDSGVERQDVSFTHLHE
mmetsp:Transcript_38687/g.90414  ORF Transcript_38687/g.90414 Transcript_38687/m.90414 type:complete len:254 (-) Transcript_38687:633-1394(-)